MTIISKYVALKKYIPSGDPKLSDFIGFKNEDICVKYEDCPEEGSNNLVIIIH